MADLTSTFKATVKTVKSRNKSPGDNISSGDSQSLNLGPKKKNGSFDCRAKDVVNIVTKLRSVLLKHRKDYINAGSHIMSESAGMTDAQRDQIDAETEKIVKTCQEAIYRLRTETGNQPQTKEHRTVVITIVENYLKAVCKIYSEQRAVRVKRVVDRKRISRLEPDKRSSHVAKLEMSKEASGGIQTESGKNIYKPVTRKENLKEKSDHEKMALSEPSEAAVEEASPVPGLEISAEEAQMFEQENQALFDEMNSMAEEVRQIEGKVMEIAKLQEIFTEKVLEQEKDINKISHTTVGTTENIKDANEDIRQAMKNKADMRVWVLFIILVSSFSLIFLDWYNT